MSGGYDTYMCYYYSYEGCPRGYVEVAGNACATCLAMGRGHQGTSSNAKSSRINKLNHQRVALDLSNPDTFNSAFGKAPGRGSTAETGICECKKGQIVACPLHRGSFRGRNICGIPFAAIAGHASGS